MINREGFFVSETERECTLCGDLFLKTSKTVTLCNRCNSDRVKSQTSETRMYRRAKTRAKIFGREFTISIDDIKIPKYCRYLGIELSEHKGRSGGEPDSPALDRIDNNKGYVVGNIQVISHLANQMKASATKQHLIRFAKQILQDYK